MKKLFFDRVLFSRWTFALLASLVLSACGGGDGESSAATPPKDVSVSNNSPAGSNDLASGEAGSSPDSSGAVAETEVPVSPPVIDRIAEALASGNSAPLLEEDKLPLLKSALAIIQETGRQQRKLIAQLIDDSTAANLDFDKNSQFIRPLISTVAFPLLTSDSGNVLASISFANGGRSLAYGKDLFGQLSSPSGNNQQQLPLFKRSMTWLITGKALGVLPETVQVAAQNYNANTISNLMTRLGSKAVMTTCAIADPTNTCWQSVDLFVFGQGTPSSDTLTDLVKKYLQAGKSVIYLHNDWGISVGGNQVLSAMGMDISVYAGNYFDKGPGYQILGMQTAAMQHAANDVLGKQEKLILDLINGSQADFSKDTSLITPIDRINLDLKNKESLGVNLFIDDYKEKRYMDSHRRLVLWADLIRRQIDYTKIVRSNSNEFLQTMASDSMSYAVRSIESVPKTFGDWMPDIASNIAPIQGWETLDINIAQSQGVTAIGRGAVPGKPVQIEIVDAADANLAIRIGNIRTRGNPLAQEKYLRARYPDGHQAALTAGKTLTYSVAWGGPLFLNYSGAKAGSVVKLRVRGGTKYAHLDFTRPITNAEIDESVQALNRADFGWQTIKLVGGEIQQTIALAKNVMADQDPRTYVLDQIKAQIFDSNHIANGYNNIPPSANVIATCAALGWDCTSAVHTAPGVQHFVGWLAQCGYLCSGNPSDGFNGIYSTWGWWHELGHNTVIRYMKLLAEKSGEGCPTECDNNVLSNASALRQYVLSNGTQNNGGNMDHKKLYQDMQASRATGKVDAALQEDMFSRFWTRSSNYHAMRSVHFQLAFIYTKERLGQTQPQPLDVIDFLGLMGRGTRLIDKTWTTANKNSLGMDLYTNKTISNHELLYVLSSMLIGRDMRQLFVNYGIPLSSTATGSIAAHNLPVLAPEFYAMVPNQGNQLERGKWVDFSTSVPAYPF